ncbi:Protein of unknown function [Cotesia congregata]|uniref:Uncharacterized protein n=1 Tax=Cotesia congregata TaxID=51543 RepID=A0A8J2HC54_COTCN|nr:Protein of unknown function [Cotesia congregata]
MSLEESRRSQRPYRYGMVLLCVGALINWLGLAENYVEPVRYVGVACIVAGALLICAAMCCWLHAPPVRTNVGTHGSNHPNTIQILMNIYCLEGSYPGSMNDVEEPASVARQKPPDYDAVADAPPSYDDAIKLNPGQLTTRASISGISPILPGMITMSNNSSATSGISNDQPTAPTPPPAYAR